MPDEVKPDQMSDDEIEKLLDGAVLPTPGYPPEREPELAPEEFQTPEAPPEEKAQDEPVKEQAEGSAVDADATPPPAEESDLEKEELKALLSEMEARARKWEQVAGRHGGKLGFLEKQLAALSQRPATAQVSEIEQDGIAEEQQVQRPARPAKPASDPMSAWVIQRAIQDGVAEFASQHQDYKDKSVQIAQYLQSIGYDTAPILESNDPVYAQTESRRALEEAYWHVVAEERASRKTELAEKRAVQTAKLKESKQRAAPSATAATPPPKPKQKTVDQLTDDELSEALTKATAGQRWY